MFGLRTKTPMSAIERLLDHGWTVMLYDGECVLCSRGVSFIAARSRSALLAFSAMQSAAGRGALTACGRPSDPIETLLVIEREGVLERSDAVLRLLDLMGGPWSRLAWAGRRVPKTLRDAAYRWVARNRYRILGRSTRCMLHDPSQRRRFLA